MNERTMKLATQAAAEAAAAAAIASVSDVQNFMGSDDRVIYGFLIVMISF